MRAFEKAAIWVRHLPHLERADWLWDPVRPIYQVAINSLWPTTDESLLRMLGEAGYLIDTIDQPVCKIEHDGEIIERTARVSLNPALPEEPVARP
jgi:hypothetical protein